MKSKETFYSTAKLAGGLGNQLFQLAHAFSQGWNAGMCPVLNLEYLVVSEHHTYKDDHIGNIFKRLPTVDNIPNIKVIKEALWVDIAQPIWDNNIAFSGYFQSQKHFLGYDEKIRSLFLPDDKDVAKIIEKYPGINKKDTISIHIRRGDYLGLKDILPSLSLDYFNYAISAIETYSHIYVFTNDVKWAKENLSYERMTIIDGNPDYFDMWTMSLCNHNIISNSTFSWWGSFLNLHKDKQIYAPSKWFGPNWSIEKHMIHNDTWSIIDVDYRDGYFVPISC